MRLVLASVCACAIAVVAARPARACGAWSMTDTQRRLTVDYLINAVSIAKGDKRWAALYFDETPSGLRVARDHEVVFDIKGGTLVHAGAPIAKVRADGSVVFAKRTYAIALERASVDDGLIVWHARVRVGDDVVITTDTASALCAGAHNDFVAPDDVQEAEVRRRIIYYLAWRETGAS